MFDDPQSLPILNVLMDIFIFAEEGDFLALDLGGTNFRILLVKIVAGENKKVSMDSQIYQISQQLMNGTGTQVGYKLQNNS